MAGKRQTDGKWLPGASGNPGGTPKGLIAEIREKFGKDTLSILEVFRDLGLGLQVKGYEEAKESDRVRAGDIVLERVLGKAPQSIEGEFSLGASPDQLALLAALRMTPEERRRMQAEIAAEDEAVLAAGVDEPDGD